MQRFKRRIQIHQDEKEFPFALKFTTIIICLYQLTYNLVFELQKLFIYSKLSPLKCWRFENDLSRLQIYIQFDRTRNLRSF